MKQVEPSSSEPPRQLSVRVPSSTLHEPRKAQPVSLGAQGECPVALCGISSLWLNHCHSGHPS